MRLFVSLFLGVIMVMLAAPVFSPARADPGRTLCLGGTEIQVLSVVRNALKASILQPATDAQRQKITEAYPEGLIHNSLNVLLLRGQGVVALVDAGYDRTVPELLAALNGAGVAPQDVTHVILTHAHGDHIGGLLQNGRPTFPRAQLLFSRKELAHWTSPELRAAAPEGARRPFDAVGAVVQAYGDRVSGFTPGTDLCSGLPGVQAVDESGHTPGHVGIMLRADGKTFLFWGDLLHAFDVQAVFPSVSSSYDMDPAAAAQVRTQLLQQARAEGWLVAGSHVPFVEPQTLS